MIIELITDSDDNDVLEVLKVGFNIARAQGSSAISDKQKTCSYGELLRSSFQVCTLLQNLQSKILLPVVNICNEKDLGRGAERQEEGSERLGVSKNQLPKLSLQRDYKQTLKHHTRSPA